MALKFDIEGYEDPDGEPVKGQVTEGDLDEVFGLFVHVYDPSKPEFHDYFWVRSYYTFDDWEDWWDLVRAVVQQSGGYELE